MRVHNKRSPEQWEIITESVNVTGKMIVDFGCGRADLLWMAARNGAFLCHGMDGDKEVIEANRNTASYYRSRGYDWERRVFFSLVDLDGDWNPATYYDIAICFAVIPYLGRPKRMLRRMRRFSKIALVEIQYTGDGPGKLDGDEEAIKLFKRVGWKQIEPLGHTVVPYRGTERVIWKLE